MKQISHFCLYYWWVSVFVILFYSFFFSIWTKTFVYWSDIQESMKMSDAVSYNSYDLGEYILDDNDVHENIISDPILSWATYKNTDPLIPALMKYPEDPYSVNNNFQQTLWSCSHYTPHQRIAFKYFWSSSRYTQHRSENPCDPCNMKIVTIEPSQWLPEIYQDNTIYLLKAWDYYVNHRYNNYIKDKSCLAIIWDWEVNIRTQYQVNEGLINVLKSKNIILDWVYIDWIPLIEDAYTTDKRSSNWIVLWKSKNITLDNTFVSNLYWSNISISNVENILINNFIGNNWWYGIEWRWNNIIWNNLLLFNNRRYGIYLYSGNDILIQNSQLFNNREWWFAAYYSWNNLLLHNNVIYNNHDYGKDLCGIWGWILFLTKYGINRIISRTMLYNNSLWGIQLVDKINSSPIATYLWTVSYDSIHEADISYITPWMYDSVLWEGSLLQTGSLVMSCDMATQVGDYFAQYPQCDYQWDLTGWFYDSTMTITYGSWLPRQSIPLIYDTNGVLQTSSIPYDSTKSVWQF